MMRNGPKRLSFVLRRGNGGLSNNRGRELAVTHTLMGGPRVLVLSSDTDTLSFTASTTLHGSLGELS